jgi:hypothetical protein
MSEAPTPLGNASKEGNNALGHRCCRPKRARLSPVSPNASLISHRNGANVHFAHTAAAAAPHRCGRSVVVQHFLISYPLIMGPDLEIVLSGSHDDLVSPRVNFVKTNTIPSPKPLPLRKKNPLPHFALEDKKRRRWQDTAHPRSIGSRSWTPYQIVTWLCRR